MIRVLLADDRVLVRAGFRMLLESAGDIEVVGEAANGGTAVALAREHAPDVVLMDLHMPEVDGVTATRLIAGDPGLAATRVVVLTTFDDDQTVFSALRAGASGFLVKDVEPEELLNEHFARQSGDTLMLAIRSQAPVTSQAVQAHVEEALAPFRQAPHVTGVTDPFTTPGHVSADGHIAYATTQFGIPGSSIANSEATALMQDATAASGHGMTFSRGGDVVDLAETPNGGPSNRIGVEAAAIVLLIAFGSLLAMGLPIATALLGIGSGLSLIALLGHIFPAPSFSPIVAALIGLGVGVDYALFVTRFRTELHEGARAEEAVVTAMRTAGKSVLTAGTTVVIGMLGLLVLRETLLNGVAIAATVAVAMTVVAALTLLPALLGFTGYRLAKPSRLNTFIGGKVSG